ncbi:nucleotide-binding protein [Methanofollis aquaemaris]|uniref:Nucleotide-binding protein n=1 Tax=Methanofollis aquaemaris TaxID=126734 RepID=A0A8A3S5J8_9EURY|nr:nucleotide-binding protein [Methanofollis aquaemaris]QSZ67537.1 nucleotide-binding protein [Methanofollis aquaemaris]
MDLSEASKRISQKFASQSVEVDPAFIEKKLRTLVEEFGVNLAEAEKTVTENIAKEHGLESVPRQTSEQREIGSLLPGEWATVEGKIVGLAKPFSPSISQTGIIADATGAIQFTAWARANAPLVEEGQSYRIESAVVDDYRGVPKLNFHAGTTITLLEENVAALPQVVKVSDLRPGVASMRVKMVQEWEARHERILQTGLVGDESGTVKFTIWKDDDATELEVGKVYNIFYASVSEFQGRLDITLNGARCFPDEEGDIEVGVGGAQYRGAIVSIGPGSGVIKRCPVEGCNRVLSRMNYCPVHEMQSDFRYDLRIKGVLDDGEKAHNILMQREVVEAVTGLSLDDAIEIAQNSPMGMDDVFYRLRDTMVGRYFICAGNDLGDTILVKECSPITYDRDRHAELLNRLGGEDNVE